MGFRTDVWLRQCERPERPMSGSVSNRYGSLSGDSEFAHPRDQGRARHTKPGGRAVPSPHHPAGLPKHVKDMVTLCSGECTELRWLVALDHAFELSRREVQVRA